MTAFPNVTVNADDELWRVHRLINHPAWFGTSGDFRFDPPPSHRDRYGVCYTGLEDRAAYVEVFGRTRHIPASDIANRRLSVMTPARDLTVADLTDRSILGDFGLTATVSTGADYDEPQELSAQLYDAGLDGILYRTSHDPAMRLEALAVFGEPGEQPERFDDIKTDVIPETLVDHMWATFGLEVIPDALLP